MTANGPISRDLTGTTLQVLLIVLLIVAGFWIIRPFLTPLIWSAIIVVATWPLMLKVENFFRGRRWAAVLLMILGLLMLLVTPLSIAIATFVRKSDDILSWLRDIPNMTLTPPPQWLSTVPAVGPRLAEEWQNLSTSGSAELTAALEPYMKQIVSWLLSQAGNVGMIILYFLLTVVISAILFAKGEVASGWLFRLASRIAGPQGENALLLSAKAIRGVALGVVLTAMFQTFVGGVGLAVTGMPAVMLLIGAMLVLCIAQLGPLLVLVPCLIWLYMNGEILSGTILLAFTVVASTADNLIRPFLIKKGANLPLALIFPGVIGGLVAFGIIGLFIGPVVLAVIYTLLQAWVAGGDKAAEELSGPPAEGT